MTRLAPDPPVRDTPLHLDRAELREFYPIAPLAPRHGLSLAPATYRRRTLFVLDPSSESALDSGALGGIAKGWDLDWPVVPWNPGNMPSTRNTTVSIGVPPPWPPWV